MKILPTLSLVALLALSGCSTLEEPAQPPQEAFGKPIQIGVAWPFSSKNDLFKEGVTLALDDINRDGGVLGRPLEAIFADDGGKVGKGKAVAQEFVDHGNLIAVVGHYDAHIADAASLTYEYNGILIITPGATHPKLTQQGFKRIVRTIPSDTQVGDQLADIARKRGYHRTAIIHEQSSYGMQLANAIEFRCEENGIEVVDRLGYDSSSRDFRLMMARLKLSQCDAIFIAGLAADAARIITEARGDGFTQPFLGGNGLDAPDLFEVDSGAVEGTLVLSVFDSHNPDPYVQFFNRHFESVYHKAPDAWAAQGYDAIQLLAHGIRAAQSKEPQHVADALKAIKFWHGITGSHSFDSNGDVHDKPMVMKIAKNGALVYFRF